MHLALIRCIQVESVWFLAGLSSIFHRFELDFGFIFEWIEHGFCTQSLDEQYALIAALNMALLLSH